MQLTELYVLAERRDLATVTVFLETFSRRREEATDEYEYPQYSDPPEIMYDGPEALMLRLENSKEERYSLYWRCRDETAIDLLMAFFNSDGGLVLGLVILGNIEPWLCKMSCFGSMYLESFESPPPSTAAEFLRFAKEIK